MGGFEVEEKVPFDRTIYASVEDRAVHPALDWSSSHSSWYMGGMILC